MIALIIILIICLFLCCGLYIPAQIYDSTDNTNIAIVENDISLETALYHQIVEGLSSSRDGVITINLDEYDVNEILYAISGNMDWGLVSVRSMYIEPTDDGYMLFVPVQVLGIDSVISGDIKLYESEKTIYAEIDNITMGRLNIDSVILSMLDIKGFITNSLEKCYISSRFDGKALHAEISRADLGRLIGDINKDASYGGLVNAIYGVMMLDTDSVSIDIEDLSDCNIVVDLSHFDTSVNDEFASVNEYTENLLNEKVIDSAQTNLIAKYYVNGYGHLTDNEKQTVTDLLGGTVGVNEVEAHEGLVQRDSISLTDILLDQFKINVDSLSPGFKISDDNINAMLTGTPFIATVWQYSSYRTNECAYIMLQSVYCHVGEDKIDLYIDLNINGYLLTVAADFTSEESKSIAISGTLNEVAFGGHKLSEENTKSLYNFLCSIMQQEWIYTDEESMSLTLDFTTAFNDNEILSAILKGSKNTVTVCKKNLLSDGGYVNIIFSLF